MKLVSLFLILSSGFLVSNSFAAEGRIISVKDCSGSGRSRVCKNIKLPEDRGCFVKTTSLSNGQYGNSSFRGAYSIPGLKIRNKKFKTSIISYDKGRYADGVVKKRGNTSAEWIGSYSERLSSGKIKVTIRDFYHYTYNKKNKAKYIEHHCAL